MSNSKMVIKQICPENEIWNYRTKKCISSELKILAINVDNKNDAIKYIIEKEIIPEKYNDSPIKEVRLESYNEGVLELCASYGTSASVERSSGTTVSFDCGGGTKHVNFAYSQQKASGSVDAGLAVGWNGKSGDDSSISGVDVPTAQLRESYTKMVRVGAITTSYKRKVSALVGKVNQSSFKGWEPGEVMFLGASYSSAQGDYSVAVTFNFSIQPNESSVSVGNMTLSSKKGWDYVWTLTKPSVSNNSLKPDVVGLYSARVVEFDDFSALGL